VLYKLLCFFFFFLSVSKLILIEGCYLMEQRAQKIGLSRTSEEEVMTKLGEECGRLHKLCYKKANIALPYP
jgi:hypothetical protein